MTDKANGNFGIGNGRQESIGGLSGLELRWSQWWLDHREQLRKIGVALFVAADAALLGYGAWGFTDWLAFGGLREEASIRQMSSEEYGHFPSFALEEIRVGAPIALPGGTGKVDLLVPVENPNANFWAELEYRFVVGGEVMPARHAFVLPGQAAYVSELGAPSSSGGSVEVRIDRRLWHRAELRGTQSAPDFAEERLDIHAENPAYAPSDPLAVSPVSNAKFTLVNGTAFGYYDVDLLVLLYRGEAVVGAGKVRVDTLAAGERKPMQLFWYQLLPQVTKIEVVPEINIYDPAAYRAPR